MNFCYNITSLSIFAFQWTKPSYNVVASHYSTSLWSCHIVAVETLEGVPKTTSMKGPIMTSLNETLQQCRFCKVVRRFHLNYMAMSKRRCIATSQRCNDILICTRFYITSLLLQQFNRRVIANFKTKFSLFEINKKSFVKWHVSCKFINVHT